jgi:integrase
MRRVVRLKYIKTIRKPSGATFTYLAAPGRGLIRLPDGPHDSTDFLAAYADAMKRAAPASSAAPGSIAAAVAAYQASPAFARLADATRSVRRRTMSQIVDKGGAGRFTDLRPKHIEADLAGLKPFAAVNRLKAWRGLCAWATPALLPVNPAAAVGRPATPRSDGHSPWTRDDLDTFRAHWPQGSRQRAAAELLQWTAARSIDAVRLGPGMVDREGWLVFCQAKTGGEVAIPFRRDLPDFALAMQPDLDLLHAALAALPDRHMTWLVTAAGAARSVKAFSAWFAGAARAAGVTKTAHGLRKFRATTLAEHGATAHQIMAWTGHESIAEAQRYARKADKRRILSGPDRERKSETRMGNP